MQAFAKSVVDAYILINLLPVSLPYKIYEYVNNVYHF